MELTVLRIISVITLKARKTIILLCLFCSTLPLLPANAQDLDNYKWRGTAYWWYSQPSGSFSSAGNRGFIDLQKDFSFGYYSTFSGYLDWHFKRKHHLLFGISPVSQSHSVTLARTITFQGETYNVGTRASADLQALSFSPGYQWDFIRRDHGYVALDVQLYLLDTKGSVSGTVIANGQSVSRNSSASFFAPLPVLGPRGRWYPLHDSDRLALDGFVQGMYFGGYGDFISTRGAVAVGLTHHLKLSAGYQLGTRLSIHGNTDRLGIRLTQKGPVVGLEGSWGTQERK
jgi:hypothetical protein